MKKTKLIGLTTLFLALGLAGCNQAKDAEWESDKTYHWTLNSDETVNTESKAKHTFEEVTAESVAATCSAAGKKVEKCTVCNHKKETTLTKLNHTYVDDAANSKAATCTEDGKNAKKCSACGATTDTKIDKLPHTYVEVANESVAATCAAPGKKVEKCSACQNKIETVLKADHSFGAATVVHEKDAAKSKLSKKACSGCTKTDLVLDAMSYLETGSTSTDAWGNKDSSGATLKMSKNGNYVDYKIVTDKAYTGCEVALYGWVDYWKDGTNDNDQRGHIVNGNATFSLTVNNTAVEVTNSQSFEEMGMTAGENGNGSLTMCYLGGTIDLVAGENTIRYARVASYNLNITEIHFVG